MISKLREKGGTTMQQKKECPPTKHHFVQIGTKQNDPPKALCVQCGKVITL